MISPLREGAAKLLVNAAEVVGHPRTMDLMNAARSMGRAGTDALPVVIQGGLATDAYIYVPVARQLERAGFRVEINMVNWHGWDSIHNDARKLASTIKMTKAKYGVDQVQILAHSKGGVISRRHIQEMGGLDSVSQLVTVGSPHRPITPDVVASMGMPSGANKIAELAAGLVQKLPIKINGANDLITDSPIMRRLNGSLPGFLDRALVTHPGFRITSISTSANGLKGDGLVPHAASMLEPWLGVRANVRDVMLDPTLGANDHLRHLHANKGMARTIAGLFAAPRQAVDGAALLPA